MTTKAKYWAAALAVLAAVVWMRLFRLDSLPGEFYGDIALMCDYVREIQAGHRPFYFVLSSGPLFPYLIYPFAVAVGVNFYAVKLACVLVSLGALAAMYRMVCSLGGERGLALLTAAVAGVSSWMLVFSRLGNNQITLVPICALSISLSCCASVSNKRRTCVLAAFVSSLGLYVYAPGFILPLAGLLVIAFLRRPGEPYGRRVLTYLAAEAVFAIPFALLVRRDPTLFFSGYIGSKFPDRASLLHTVGLNVWHGLLAFHIRGDIVFRSNPGGMPHLDPLSGVLMLVGIGFWFAPNRRRIGWMLLSLFLLLQLPSMLVRATGEVPSASRTVAAMPIVYLYVASGIWWLAHRIKRRHGFGLAVPAIVAVIALLNFERYFDAYAQGLPNHNVAYGRMISDYVDALPKETTAILVGCCWGDRGQPELSGIRYVARTAARVRMLNEAQIGCDALAHLPRPAVLIWDPRAALPAPQTAQCLGGKASRVHFSRDGQAVFRTMDPFE